MEEALQAIHDSISEGKTEQAIDLLIEFLKICSLPEIDTDFNSHKGPA